MRRRLRAPAASRSMFTRSAVGEPATRTPVALPLPYGLLARMPAGTRARLVADLQRTVGNAAACDLITEPHRPSVTVHGGGPSVSLHGDTTAAYDGGKSQWSPKSMKRAKGCTECPDDDPCLHAVGTFNVTYHADVTIRMPDMPDGLTECQQRRVRAFLRDVLGPHEREHSRRFHTYDGTTTHRIDFTGCGTSALQEHLQAIHDNEEEKRHTAADALSAAIDPFNKPIDLDCQD
ncbi:MULTISPECIES: hypothetical protein [Mycolicibacterium]|uniref:hypothetical protein n=1 Tax=Mycolicibacterium TaxID=1866885 RepID=UPI00114D5702|nr:hypothetical protein [Mycolicibacterium mageritense]MBN3458663.1 hypothetical protein [Mycobacterium sp. DSM 3803]TXI62768.1 MAG: hypothetical protein E6Q55_11460 [Mycolicibacterium mageritense]